MVDWVSLTIPLAYSVILVGSLAAFSWVYRRRQALHAASLEPWFGQHLQRDIYYSLWNMNDGSGTKVPESLLKAALLRRAAEDVGRIIQMRQSKQALSNLLARGSVGDDLWQRFQRAEKELEAELQDVVSEANALSPNWGQVIFQSANEMAANARLRKRLHEIEATKGPEHEWWEKKQATVRDEFMKELDATEGSKGGSGAAASTTAATTTATAAAATPEAEGSTAGSEDGVVVVDAAAANADGESSDGNTGPNTPTTSGSAEGGSRKKNKKKGKK